MAQDTKANSAFLWIEGDKPSTVDPASFQPTITPGPTSILSDGKWMNLNIGASEVDSTVPDNGITFSYPAVVVTAGDYDIWMHVGYEQVRATFDWRIDQNDWRTVENTENTIDLQELGIWAPIGWLNLGKQNLTAGSHTRQIRVNKTKNKDGKYLNLFFGVDTFLPVGSALSS